MSTQPPRSTFRGVLKDKAFWTGFFGLVTGLIALAFLFNFAVMPLWTRHDAAVAVPSLRDLSADVAEQQLRSVGLRGELREQPYNPTLPADVVVDQTPGASTQVKPGRRIYYYVNASPRELVTVPNVTSLAEGVARPRLTDAGLAIGSVAMDTLRSPERNTVLRQVPAAGRQVPKGTRVSIWLSPGPGGERVRIPNVVGLSPEDARARLRAVGLWVESPRATGVQILSQEPRAGELLQPGREVLIYTTERPRSPELPPATPPRPTPQAAPPPAPEPEPSTDPAPVDPPDPRAIASL